ncbi:MAG: glycosyltransferase [Flavobacteriales bacterium]
MHVLLITPAYKSDFNQLSALFFRDQAMALKNSGCQVGVICPLPISFKSIWHKKSIRFKDEFYDDFGINTYVRKFPSLPKMVNLRQAFSFRFGKQLFKLYIEKNGLPDIIHVHTFWPGELAIWIKENYSIPYVVTEHSTGFSRKLYSKKIIEYARNTYQNSKINIAVSEPFCQLLKGKFDIPFQFIPNVVDTTFFSPSDNVKEKKEFVFLNIAHLDKKKNHAGLINAFSNQFKGDMKYKLEIVGGGEEFTSLANLINEIGVQKQVFLLGRKSREDVRAIIQRSNCFVLSSIHETFGVVLIEAMSCGLPVLSTKSGGPESIITSDELGILCEFYDLEKALKVISTRTYNSNTIRNHVLNHFSEKVVTETLIQYYND